MFDFEKSISEWRAQMLATGIKSPVPLEELEIHLREEIERQMKLGINEQQAFEFAVQEIGNAKMLKDEFKKNQFTEELRKRKLNQKLIAGSLLVNTLLIVFIVLSSRIGIGGLKNDQLTNAQQISILTGLSVMIMLAVGGRLSYRLFPVISSKRIRDVIGFSVGAGVIAYLFYFSHFSLPRHDYTVGQVVVAVLWNMMLPIGIFLGIDQGIQTAAWKKREKDLLSNQD